MKLPHVNKARLTDTHCKPKNNLNQIDIKNSYYTVICCLPVNFLLLKD